MILNTFVVGCIIFLVSMLGILLLIKLEDTYENWHFALIMLTMIGGAMTMGVGGILLCL